ncbi:MAG: hypothetical protein QXY83_02660, partial [Thermosphaera sp.]
AITIWFVGFDGCPVKDIADFVIWFPENHYGRVEDVHMMICHIITNYLAETVEVTDQKTKQGGELDGIHR